MSADEASASGPSRARSERFGRLDILVNNAAEQHPQESLLEISAEQLERTFRTNVFGYFFMAKAALPYLPEGGAIINTTSVTAYRGSSHLIDYASTRGAIVAFTRSLAQNLAEPRHPGQRRGTWADLDAADPGELRRPTQVESFGAKVPLRSPGPAQRGRALPPFPRL